MNIQQQLKYLLCILIMICFGCDDFIEIDQPKTELVRQSVFLENATTEAAVSDIYYTLLNGLASGNEQGVTALTALSSDELILKTNGDPLFQEFYNNQILANNSVLARLWRSFYNTIYKANAAIEGISSSGDVLSKKNQLLGEVKFIRAFSYFYLMNLWGDVPLATSTDYAKNSTLSRAPLADVYDLIISDLFEAGELLTDDYTYSNGKRTRANKGAVSALLARVHLYHEDWNSAEIEATKVINSIELYSLESDPNLAFRTSSPEAIFQLWDNKVPSERYTFAVSAFYQGPNFGSMSRDLINSFEPDDLRYSKWINSVVVDAITYYGSTKYKFSNPPLDYTTVLRLAEQYLIRAEARAHQNKLLEAADDINAIRSRAQLENTSASTQEELLEAIMVERYHELFSEWGHRWFDLKRTGRTDGVLAPLKSSWNSEDVLYPIPESQLISNPNIIQNPS